VEGEGLSRILGRIHTGGNSGYQAVGLAHQLGAKSIILVGFDMKMSGGKVHWHGDHPAHLGNEGPYDKWVSRFRSLATGLKQAGVKIVNASRETALDTIQRMDLQVALNTPSAEWREPLFVQCMYGLGDTIYQRGVLEALSKQRDLYVETPWPQLYADIPTIKCVRPDTMLRTQVKNVKVTEGVWAEPPKGCETRRVTYAHIHSGTMMDALCQAAGVDKSLVRFSAPPVSRARRARPYILVRPATLRSEWRADARGPKPEYLAQAIEVLRKDFHIISVADLEPGKEWALPPLPYADEIHHSGELHVMDLMSLVAGAAGVVGGIGWLAPVAAAYKVPALLVFGGAGLFNGPERIFDPVMDTSHIVQAIPDNFCMCGGTHHACDKTIRGFAGIVAEFALRCAPPPRASVAPRTRHRVLPGHGAAL
jgi:hypothetical protein